MNQADSPTSAHDIVSVCICTFRRPEGVVKAINSVIAQQVPAGWQIEIVVVDNDRNSIVGESIKQAFAQTPDSVLRLVYVVEEQPGVSFARNRCLKEAQGSLIAFIDDDEQATPLWLVRMMAQMEKSDADAVFGPVVSEYSTAPPDWLVKCAIQDRLRFPSGKVIAWGDTRTGNVLFRRSLLVKVKQFDSRFAKTGSEDTFFFYQAASNGARLVWCDDAIVLEYVPPERMSRQWVLRRQFFGGRNFVFLRVSVFGPSAYFGWGLHGLAMATVALPVTVALLCVGHSGYMRFAIRTFSGLGKLVAPFYRGGVYAAPD